MKRILSYGPRLKTGLRKHISAESAADAYDEWRKDYLGRLEPFATSGKLLRGCVLCFAYEAFSGKKPDNTVTDAAMALEITHSALLIHDDIMDDDDRRRGRPSMHRQYQAAADNEGLADSKRFGVNIALAGGDAALFMAFGLLGRAQAARADHRFYGLFIDQLSRTCAGQMQDVYLEARPAMAAKRDIYALMRTKTAAYTLALPLAMGAAMAGAPDATIRQLERIGIAGGTIFQIRDDELGALGDPAKTGKPVGADITEGKQTLFRHYLYKASTPAERRKLDGIFGNPGAGAGDIRYVQDLARRHKVPDKLSRDIERLERQALSNIDKLELPGALRSDFKDLIGFCSARQY